MRGIELILPKFKKSELVPADFITWEALYIDGTLLREVEGAKYAAINRSALRSFRLHQAGETLLESFVPVGATGWDLCYRRSTITRQSTEGGLGVSRRVIFVVGWVPTGPAFVVDPSDMTCRVNEDGFTWNDPTGDLHPVTPRPHEGEHFTFDHLLDERTRLLTG